MSKYDNITLEQDLNNSITRKAEKAARVGLNFVARGGSLDEARAKIKAACKVSDDALGYALSAATVIESKALAHFEVNLAEAQAKAVVYLEKVAAEEVAREEEAKVEAQAHQIIAEIADLAFEVRWPFIFADSMESQCKIRDDIKLLQELGVCGRPWFDPHSATLSRFKLTSISNKYMP